MKIDKVKKQLKKINNLFSTIEDEGQISAIEKDLLKNYVMELYEKVVLDEVRVKEPKAPKSSKKESKTNQSDNTESIFSSEVPAPIKTDTLEKVVERELQTVTNGISPSMDMEAVIDIHDDGLDVSKDNNQLPPEMNEKIELIFQNVEGNDLSEKLSKRHIKDLNKAIGLNEKIFTINELFKGNGSHYKEVMNDLNEMSTIDEAKIYLLENVINRYEWYEDKKIKKASHFIKLIQRRYL